MISSFYKSAGLVETNPTRGAYKKKVRQAVLDANMRMAGFDKNLMVMWFDLNIIEYPHNS